MGPAWYVDEALAEADDGNCALAVNHPTGSCDLYRPIELPRYGRVTDADADAGSPPTMIEREVPRNGGMTSMLPDHCWGRYPADAYRIHYRADGFWSFDEKVFGIATGTIHAIGKGSMQVGLAMMDFGFATFRIVDYKRIALTAASNYDTKLVGPLGLVEIAWFVLFAYAAIQALRGKLGIAGGEIAMSIMLLTLASVLMANREGYLDGVADTTDRLTSSVLSAGAGRRPSDSHNPYDTLQPLQRTLFDEFVDRPFDYIHFGGEITEPTCRQRRDRILYANVPKDHGWGSRYMADGGDECRQYARSMGQTTAAKMLMASVTTVVCFAVAFALAAMSFTMALAKTCVMGVFVAAPFAAVAAPLPGAMRRLAWGWFSILVQAVLTAVAMALLLSIFVLGIDGVVDNTETMGTFERWLVMLVIVAIVFMLRRHLVDGTRRASSSIGDTLTRLSPAAAHWQGGGGGTGGLDLRAGERALGSYGGAHAPMVGLAAVGAVGGLVATGWGRRATGKRALRNLVYMEDKKAIGGRALPRNRVLRRASLPLQRARGTGGPWGHMSTGGRRQTRDGRPAGLAGWRQARRARRAREPVPVGEAAPATGPSPATELIRSRAVPPARAPRTERSPGQRTPPPGIPADVYQRYPGVSPHAFENWSREQARYTQTEAASRPVRERLRARIRRSGPSMGAREGWEGEMRARGTGLTDRDQARLDRRERRLNRPMERREAKAERFLAKQRRADEKRERRDQRLREKQQRQDERRDRWFGNRGGRPY